MWMSQFKKILSQNFKKLILRCWSGILDCVNKYGIIMLINVMKFDELTITMVFSNPNCLHTKKSGPEKHCCSFQHSWFKLFPTWLEYSPTKDASFCLPCFLFHKPSGNPRQNAFTVDGFSREGF